MTPTSFAASLTYLPDPPSLETSVARVVECLSPLTTPKRTSNSDLAIPPPVKSEASPRGLTGMLAAMFYDVIRRGGAANLCCSSFKLLCSLGTSPVEPTIDTMDLEVHVIQVELKETPNFSLRCKVRAGRENHEHCSVISPPPTGIYASHVMPKMTFNFLTKPKQISMVFVANSTHPSKELGSAEETLSVPEVTKEEDTTRVLRLSKKIPGTDTGKYVGKLTYRFHFSIIQASGLVSMLNEEAKRSCRRIFPSTIPAVSVVFHCACVSSALLSGLQLVPLACIGDRCITRNNSLLQAGNSSSASLQRISLLKQVHFCSQNFECLELHVGDTKSDSVLFSSSLALNRLVPFKPVHMTYNSSSTPGPVNLAQNTSSSETDPNVIVTVLRTPSLSEFTQFVGLEVAVCNIHLPIAIQQSNSIVIGVQLVQQASKKKFPSRTIHSSQPPFQPSATKGNIQCNEAHNYSVSVIKYNGEKESSPCKVYLFFPKGPSFRGQCGVYLEFHIYGCTHTEIWWKSENLALAHLDIGEDLLMQLQNKEIQYFPWKVTSGVRLHQCTISGLVHWKSQQEPFLSECSLREAFTTLMLPLNASPHSNSQYNSIPSQNTTNKESVNAQPAVDQHPQSVPLKQALQEVVTLSISAPEIRNLSQSVQQLESTLKQMANDCCVLRQENQRLHAENEKLQLEAVRLKSVVAVHPQEQSRLESLSAMNLIHFIQTLQLRLEIEEKTRKEYQDELQVVRSNLSEAESTKVQIVQLQELHISQQKLVHLLRGKVEKYRKCSELCQKQEYIITQLESLLTKQAQGNPSAKNDAIALFCRENAQLRAMLQQYAIEDDGNQQASLAEKDQTIQTLKSQLSKLISQCQQLEAEQLHGSSQLQEQKLIVAEAKLSAQTKYLRESTEQWMSQKKHYELQLAECHGQLERLVKSSQQALLSVQTAELSPTTTTDTPKQGNCNPNHSPGKLNTKDFSF